MMGRPANRPTARSLLFASLVGSVGISVAATVIAVLAAERMRVDHELQLIAPAQAKAGQSLPLRVLLFDRLGQPDGPRRVDCLGRTCRARAEVEGPGWRTRAALTPTSVGAEGILAVPAHAHGRARLKVRAWLDDEPVASASKPVDVSPDPPPSALGVGRPATDQQQLRLYPVEAEPEAPPPDRMEVRVEGGACAAEHPCRLMVWVGRPAAAITLLPENASALTIGRPQPASATEGLVHIPLRVRTSEAEVVLVASRQGRVVARRRVIIPVALATPGLRLDHPILTAARPNAGANVPLSARVLGRNPRIVDGFVDGAWRFTQTFEAEQAVAPRLPPGLWTLQLRTSPYSAERSAIAHVFVQDGARKPGRATGRTVGEPLAALERLARQRSIPLGPRPPGPREAVFRFQAARLEAQFHPLPASVTGYPADLERLEARRTVLRTMAALALLAGCFTLGAYTLRRGAHAAAEAHRVMAATGDPRLASSAHRRKLKRDALFLSMALLCAVLGAGAILAARTGLFGTLL